MQVSRLVSRPAPAALAMLLLAAACEDLPTPSDAPSARNSVSSAQPRGGIRTIDDEFTDFVREVPGFGGLYLEDSVVTIVSTNPGMARAARMPVEGLLRRLKRDDLVPLTGDLRVVQGQYDFARLASWHARLVKVLPAGVFSTDVDERRNRISLGVRDASVSQAVYAAAASAGVPREAVIVREVPATRMEATLRQHVRPLVGGLQIHSNAGTCSLGFIAKRRYADGSFDPTPYFVTNSHCTDARGAVTSMSIGQPDIYNPVGVEVADPAFFDSNTNGNCPAYRQCRYSDAALFSINSTVSYSFPYIASVGSTTNQLTIQGTHIMNGQVNALVGDLARKVGRTTGFSESNVEATCENFAQYDPYGYDTGITMLCQSRAGYTSSGGDSGGPVYIRRNGNSGYVRDAMGVHWGSGGVFSNISYVTTELVNAGEQLFVAEHLGRTY